MSLSVLHFYFNFVSSSIFKLIEDLFHFNCLFVFPTFRSFRNHYCLALIFQLQPVSLEHLFPTDVAGFVFPSHAHEYVFRSVLNGTETTPQTFGHN